MTWCYVYKYLIWCVISDLPCSAVPTKITKISEVKKSSLGQNITQINSVIGFLKDFLVLEVWAAAWSHSSSLQS